MSTFFANYPVSGSAGGSNPSVGPTGATAPTEATEVGFIDDSTGFLAPFSGATAASGPNVAVTSSALPTGAATAANQVTQETTLTAIQANQTNGTQVVTQSSGANLHVDVDASALPTGASTSALQSTGNTSLASILADMTNGTQITNITGTVPLPTGASTSALQTTGNTSLASILSNQTNGTQTVTGTGTAGTPASGVLTVQGISGGTPQPISGTVGTTAPVNANGTFSGSLSVTTTEGSTAAPANAVGVVFEAESGNAVNIRWGVSNSATTILSTTSGVLMEPGRSIDFLPIGTGTYLHYIATAAGSNVIDIQWILRA